MVHANCPNRPIRISAVHLRAPSLVVIVSPLFLRRLSADDVRQDLHGLVHVFGADMLIGSVEGRAAGAEVRAGQAAEAQLRAVGPAAHRADHRLEARRLHGLHGALHHVFMSLERLGHVAVFHPEGEAHRAAAVLFVHGRGDLAHPFAARGEALRVVVADDVFELGAADVPRDFSDVEIALVALGSGGDLVRRQHGVDLHGHQRGVDHNALGRAGMDAHALDPEAGGRGVEGFAVDLFERAAVHRVREVRAEALKVQQGRPVSDLLVRREAHRDAAVGQPPLHQALADGQDLRDPGLVVRAEQGRPVGGDEGVAEAGHEVRELRGTEHQSAVAEQDPPAVIVRVHPGPDVFAAEIRGRVDVRDQPDHGVVLPSRRRRQEAVDIGVLVREHALESHLLHLRLQKARQIDLLDRAGQSGFLFAQSDLFVLAEHSIIDDRDHLHSDVIASVNDSLFSITHMHASKESTMYPDELISLTTNFDISSFINLEYTA